MQTTVIIASNCPLFSSENGKFFPGPSSQWLPQTTEFVSLQKLCPDILLLEDLGKAQKPKVEEMAVTKSSFS